MIKSYIRIQESVLSDHKRRMQEHEKWIWDLFFGRIPRTGKGLKDYIKDNNHD